MIDILTNFLRQSCIMVKQRIFRHKVVSTFFEYKQLVNIYHFKINSINGANFFEAKNLGQSDI
jgi:hypothetical protein